jgi:hypothetical protein
MMNRELSAFGNTLVVIGIVCGTEQLIGYSLIGAEVLLSIISTIRLKRKKIKSSGMVVEVD